jgi:nucleoside-diphosphate-sugar epimerase
LKSDASPWHPIVHIEKASRAFIAALDPSGDEGRNDAFDVGQTDPNYRIRKLAEILAESVPGREIELAADTGPDKRSHRATFEKIRGNLAAFGPRGDPSAAAKRLYKASLSSGLTLKVFEGRRYQRIARVEKLLVVGILDANLRRTRSLRTDDDAFVMAEKL